MNSNLKKITLASIIGISIALLIIIFITRQNPQQVNEKSAIKSVNTQKFNEAELSKYDGISNECYVAIKNNVYKIKDGQKWQNGTHTPTDGKITCGKDWTSEITKSPHGNSVLNRLEMVGSYEP